MSRGAAGVSWNSYDKRWRARIRADAGDGKRKKRHLGSFANEVDAALAYDQAAREHHEDNAKLNFPEAPPQPQMASSVAPRQPATSKYRGEGSCTHKPPCSCSKGQLSYVRTPSLDPRIPSHVCGPVVVKESMLDVSVRASRRGIRAAGVFWESRKKRWIAQIQAKAGDGKSKRHLGSFLSEEDAALAYDQAAREHHKDKAKLNFPDLPPQPRLTKTPSETTSQYRGKGRCTYVGTWDACLVRRPGDAPSKLEPGLCGAPSSRPWNDTIRPSQTLGLVCRGLLAWREQEMASQHYRQCWRWQEQEDKPGKLLERGGCGAGLRPSGARAS
jgi:hypothetical protein